jgi:two-component system sensor histidine kinase KdpD
MAREWTLRRLRGVWRYAAALVFVMGATLVAEVLYRVFETDRLSMVFLAGVLITAVSLGQGPAYFAAAAAFVIYDIYLVEPRFEFTMNSAEDFLVLFVFLAVAMMTGRLAGRVREAQHRAEARARTAGALFRASEEFSTSDNEDAVRQALAQRIGEAGGGEAVVFHEGRSWSWPAGFAVPEAFAQNADPDVELAGWRRRRLQAGGALLGVAAWRAAPLKGRPVEDDERLVDVLVDMAGEAIARSRLAAERAEMQARGQTEQLRNALLSSISHDLRTPLAAILASATSLREFGDRFDAEVREDLTLTIQEEAERLNRFVANLLNMTKLESGALTIEGVPFGVAEVVGRVVQRVQRRAGAREFVIDIDPGDLAALGDPILTEQALANVVENAVRFASNGGRIDISGRREEGRVIIDVADEGPGAPQADLQLIFEKFYRSSASSANQQGTGLGLSITRGLVEAMGGEVVARARGDGRTGLVVSMTLPGARS